MFRFKMICSCILIVTASGCASTHRDAAGIIAANANRANAEIEKMTGSRTQIEAARTRLIDALERSTLEADSATARRVEVWRTFAETDAMSKVRVQMYDATQRHVQAASDRQEQIDKLDEKLKAASVIAKGSRSKGLTATASYLATLSKERSLKQELAFLFEYAKNVQKSIETASKDAQLAAERANQPTDTGRR